MKNNIPCRDGFIYKSMKMHRIKLICYIVVVFILFSLYFLSCRPYVMNVLFGSSPFDADSFAQNIKVQNLNEISDDGSINIKSYSLKSLSYWQDGKYEFDIPLEEVTKTEFTYTTKNTNENHSEEDGEGVISAISYTAQINGVNTIILAYPHQSIASGDTVCGIFTELPGIVRRDMLSDDEYRDTLFAPYLLDIRGIEMESERFDMLFCTILLVIILLLIIKAVVHFVNPLKTPTYRSLDKYGELENVVNDIEEQLKIVNPQKISKKIPIYTTDWIVSEDSFKLKIVKNHAKPQDSSRYGSKL